MAEDKQYLDLTADEAIKLLSTSPDGLEEAEAKSRLEKYGMNTVQEERTSPILKFLKKFWAPVPWMLEITAAVTFLIGKDVDTYIIISLLLFNGFVGFLQESKADSAVELLSQKIRVNARVIRDKKWRQIPSAELVPGDVVYVRMGDVVPADLKIISGEVSVDQSQLTGESVPVRRTLNEVIFSGSVLNRGEANCVVLFTGSKTMYGRTAELVRNAKSESHLENLVIGIVKYLALLDVALVLALVIFSLFVKVPLNEVIPFSLVVLIASIPVALPATFTVATTYGAIDLSKKGALVTKLSAVEDAATMDSICFDKTGTLTQNRLSVSDPIPFGIGSKELISFAMAASNESSLDSIDIAIINYGKKIGATTENFTIKKFVPFDPSTKRTECLLDIDGKEVLVAKGAPQVITEMFEPTRMDEISDKVTSLATRGYRAIGVGISRDGKKEFSGIIPLRDPPLPDSQDLIKKIKSLGLQTRMITGDSVSIAKEISKEVGIGEHICKISEVMKGDKSVEDCDTFAEVLPEDKFFIVKSLQKTHHITGMTGDGVNDAPALKQAEVGIAVSSATDVAKASASIVLTHPGLTDIVYTVEDGRKIFQRMLTYTLNKIIKTIQVVVFLTLSFFIFRFFVTTPFDIILLIFANDFVTMSIATDSVRPSSNPEKWNVRSLLGSSISLAAFTVVELFVALIIALRLGLNHSQIDTFIFDMLVFSGLFTVFMVRERGKFWNSMPSRWLIISTIADIIFVSLISFLGVLVTPIGSKFVAISLGLAFLSMVIIDELKGPIFKHYKIK
ncbi:MAG: plasma-membrane proton-efflux P-type ATPase [Thermoplasmatales archaeon]